MWTRMIAGKVPKIVDNLGVIIFTMVAFCIKWSLSDNINNVMYSFKYAIDQENIGLRTHHFEERNGDLVRGSYSLLERDGRIRIVEYEVAGPKGFRALVKYRRPPGQPLMGHLRFPQYFRETIRLAEPVGYITSDLFMAHKTYPNIGL